MKINISIFLILLVIACKKTPIEACNDTEALYKTANYSIGTAVNWDLLQSDIQYETIVQKQFNSITAENIFKPAYLHPAENIFDWTNADSLFNYCTKYHKRLYGHTLIWHQQLPQWMLNFQGNTAAWDNMMKLHIQTIMLHFKGKVKAWDVVNEAFNEDGTLRNTIWLQHIGNSYIEKAYQYAKQADADALLFYNDYNIESNNNKRTAILSLLNNLRNKGIKIDGIGLQMHINTSSAEPSEITNTIKLFSDNSYKVHLSELDISVNPLSSNSIDKDQAFNTQAKLLVAIVKAYNQLPNPQQFGITFWGVSDQHSWIRDFYNRVDYPLLYDDTYQPKPMYCSLKNNL
jgi:endo-1,4-beta-xylanase